jgi:hypothetical protein
MEVLKERKVKGIRDETGTDPSPINEGRSNVERGKENLEKLIGRPLTGPQRGFFEQRLKYINLK